MLKWFGIIGAMEGVSFLLLLAIAMPLKYWMDMPKAVSIVGMAHGFLFMLYLYWLAMCVRTFSWPFKLFVYGFLAAVLPFGPFVFDKMVRTKYATQS